MSKNESWKWTSPNILLDEGLQARHEMNDERIREYADDMKHGATFPPITVYQKDDGIYSVVDGVHRYLAAKEISSDFISAELLKGDRRDAILAAVGANATHGLPRTNADKQKAVRMLLQDKERGAWSDGTIAKNCAVSQPFVSKIRRKMAQNGFEFPDIKKTADGKRMDTTNIGCSNYSEEPAKRKEIEVIPDGEDQNDNQKMIEVSELTPPADQERSVTRENVVFAQDGQDHGDFDSVIQENRNAEAALSHYPKQLEAIRLKILKTKAMKRPLQILSRDKMSKLPRRKPHWWKK